MISGIPYEAVFFRGGYEMNTLSSEMTRLVQSAFAQWMKDMFPDANPRSEEVEILEGTRHPLIGICCRCVWQSISADFFWWKSVPGEAS